MATTPSAQHSMLKFLVWNKSSWRKVTRGKWVIKGEIGLPIESTNA
jgi:hypothetical protein